MVLSLLSKKDIVLDCVSHKCSSQSEPRGFQKPGFSEKPGLSYNAGYKELWDADHPDDSLDV